ncbi:MAG: hypothetical protein Q9226_002166 [Calogaya cf. arnoldii]
MSATNKHDMQLTYSLNVAVLVIDDTDAEDVDAGTGEVVEEIEEVEESDVDGMEVADVEVEVDDGEELGVGIGLGVEMVEDDVELDVEETIDVDSAEVEDDIKLDVEESVDVDDVDKIEYEDDIDAVKGVVEEVNPPEADSDDADEVEGGLEELVAPDKGVDEDDDVAGVMVEGPEELDAVEEDGVEVVNCGNFKRVLGRLSAYVDELDIVEEVTVDAATALALGGAT